MKVAVGFLLLAMHVAVSGAVLTEAAAIAECTPCEIDVGGKAGRWAATFDVSESDGERVIRSVRLASTDGRSVVLPVREMTPVPAGGRFFFGPQDINFDGCQDLLLMVDEGAANASAEYWVYDGAKSTWVPAGRHPVFQTDPKNKRLITFERGGYGGRIYERNEYAFAGGSQPVLMRQEKQTLVRAPDRFRRTVRERVNGRLRITQRRIVSGSEPMEAAP